MLKNKILLVIISSFIGSAIALTIAEKIGFLTGEIPLVLTLALMVCAITTLPFLIFSQKQSKQIRGPKLAGVNEPCPCGSGKKYKKCCLGK